MKKSHLLSLCMTVPFILTASPAFSQESSSPVTFSGSLDVLTDYRFRGVSLTGKDPAVQGALDATFDNGFHIGAWGSNIDDFNGAKTEVDFIGGYGGSVGDVSFDAGVIYYSYLSGTGTNYWEVYGTAGITVGDVDLTGGLAFVPSQDNVGNDSNIYVTGDASYSFPDTPLSLNFHVGLEDGAFGSNKVDWSIGASYSYKFVNLGLSYIDTNKPGAMLKGAVIASVGVAF